MELACQTIFIKNYPNKQKPLFAPGIEASVPPEKIENYLSFGKVRLLRLEVKEKYIGVSGYKGLI